MTKKVKKYRRCKKCGELVVDPENCANCKHHNPLSLYGHDDWGTGRRDAFTLDAQEGNTEEFQ